jgi:hypothetical protein
MCPWYRLWNPPESPRIPQDRPESHFSSATCAKVLLLQRQPGALTETLELHGLPWPNDNDTAAGGATFESADVTQKEM